MLEDELTLGEGLRDDLGQDGYLVDWYSTLTQAWVLASDPNDAWLLDWNLPDGSALDRLRGLRSKGAKTPALVLTARDLLSDRIYGLDSGADDFLLKPFAPQNCAPACRMTATAAPPRKPSRICSRRCGSKLTQKGSAMRGLGLVLPIWWFAHMAGILLYPTVPKAFVLNFAGQIRCWALWPRKAREPPHKNAPWRETPDDIPISPPSPRRHGAPVRSALGLG